MKDLIKRINNKFGSSMLIYLIFMIFFSCDSNNDGADCNKLLDIYSNASVDFYGGEELPTKEECVAFYNSYVNAYDEGCVNTEFSVSDLSEMRNGIYCNDVYCNQLDEVYKEYYNSFIVNYNVDTATVEECYLTFNSLLDWVDAGCDSSNNTGFTDTQLDSMRDSTYCLSLIETDSLINEENIVGTWSLIRRIKMIYENTELIGTDTLNTDSNDAFYNLTFNENGDYNYTGQLDSIILNGNGTWNMADSVLLTVGDFLYMQGQEDTTSYEGSLYYESQTLSLSHIEQNFRYQSTFNKQID